MGDHPHPSGEPRARRPSLAPLVVALGLLLVVLVGLAPAAGAHASLVSTEPASQARLTDSPSEIVLQFDEPVEAVLGGIQLYDGEEREHDLGPTQRVPGDDSRLRAAVEGELSEGLYAVTWQATSADGHPVSGAFTFQVGTGAVADASGLLQRLLAGQGTDSAVGGLLAASRFVSYIGMALLAGGLVFLLAAWPGGARRSGAKRLLWAGWIAVTAGALAGFALQGAYASGGTLGDAFDPTLWDEVAGTRFGQSMLLRLGGAAIALVAVLLLRRRGAAWWRLLVGAATVLLSFSFAFSGHGGTGRLPGFGLVLGTLHVGAMSIWLGGLAYLAIVVLRPTPAPAPLAVGAAVATAAPEAPAPLDEATLAVRRFSAMAGVAIAVVVLSGVLQALRIVEGWSALWDTDYGRLLLVKAAIVLVVLAVAAVSRNLVRRRWPARRDLRKAVVGEVVLAAAVLAVTAVLVGTSPNVSAASGPVTVTLVQADTIVSVAIDPSRSGSGNAFHVYISPPGGSLARVQGVEARLSMPSRGLDAIPLPLAEEGVNHYSAYDVQLPYPGEWQFDLRVRTTADETVRFTSSFDVRR